MTKKKFFFWYSIWNLATLIALLALTVAHIYVRWKINKDFSFLPGFGFESIVFLALGQSLGLVYLFSKE